MTNNQERKYQSYIKRAWAIYALITIAFIVVLVLFVAQDIPRKPHFQVHWRFSTIRE
jgi:hypothetical protein